MGQHEGGGKTTQATSTPSGQWPRLQMPGTMMRMTPATSTTTSMPNLIDGGNDNDAGHINGDVNTQLRQRQERRCNPHRLLPPLPPPLNATYTRARSLFLVS